MAYNLEHLQVQLIEDNPNMRALVKAMLEALGMQNVRDYANGRQALDALHNRPRTSPLISGQDPDPPSGSNARRTAIWSGTSASAGNSVSSSENR